jgi:hypothetical protein
VPTSYKQALIDLDARWGDATYWQSIYRNSSPYTANYLLSSLDLQKNQAGEIVKVSEGQAIYQDVLSALSG